SMRHTASGGHCSTLPVGEISRRGRRGRRRGAGRGRAGVTRAGGLDLQWRQGGAWFEGRPHLDRGTRAWPSRDVRTSIEGYGSPSAPSAANLPSPSEPHLPFMSDIFGQGGPGAGPDGGARRRVGAVHPAVVDGEPELLRGAFDEPVGRVEVEPERAHDDG